MCRPCDCGRQLLIWEKDQDQPVLTLDLNPGDIYLCNVATCSHQVVQSERQLHPLLEVPGLGPSVVPWNKARGQIDFVESCSFVPVYVFACRSARVSCSLVGGCPSHTHVVRA